VNDPEEEYIAERQNSNKKQRVNLRDQLYEENDIDPYSRKHPIQFYESRKRGEYDLALEEGRIVQTVSEGNPELADEID